MSFYTKNFRSSVNTYYKYFGRPPVRNTTRHLLYFHKSIKPNNIITGKYAIFAVAKQPFRKRLFRKLKEVETRGIKNEIDIVAENELNNEATFFEVKRKAANIDIEVLKQKAAAFLRATGEFKGYDISYKALSMDNM